MKYDACSPTPCYRTADDTMQIKPDDEIRVKVISIREDANDIFVLGTLLDDYLGELFLKSFVLVNMFNSCFIIC